MSIISSNLIYINRYLLCEVCDRSIIENESEYYNYPATLLKKDDKSLYKKCTINNVNLDESYKLLNHYISTYTKILIFNLIILILQWNLVPIR